MGRGGEVRAQGGEKRPGTRDKAIARNLIEINGMVPPLNGGHRAGAAHGRMCGTLSASLGLNSFELRVGVRRGENWRHGEDRGKPSR